MILKFLKDNVTVTALHQTDIIDLCIKHDTFPLKCKITNTRLLFKKELMLKLRTIDLFLY